MVKNYSLVLILIIALFGTATAQDSKNSLEVSPFTGLQIFTAEGYKLGGSFYGAEGVYHINMADNKADWVHMLNIRDVSIALSYRDLEHISLTKTLGTEGF